MTEQTDKSYLLELNEAQRSAVEYNDGPALVIAGAGSGKTRVLVYKLLHLINCGYKPDRLMALTFTNKAAGEMIERIASVIGEEAYRIKVGTFHSIFASILREHAELLGYNKNFTIYNSSDSKNKIKQIIKSLDLDDKVYTPKLVQSRISRAKNHLQLPEQYIADKQQKEADDRSKTPRIGEIYHRYMRELKLANAMDFDDLLMQTNVLFRSHPDILSTWQERIDYLLIDEYQDTNFAQFMIALQLMKSKRKLFVVGDDAQSIYSFRGANIQNILSFDQSFQGAKLFKLEQNYRSTRTIVKVARHLIAHNQEQIPKNVFSMGDEGEPIEIHEALDGEQEANWVTQSIENRHQNIGAEYKDFAVLYRTNQQSRILEQKLRIQGIPFRIWGGRSFFDHKEVLDIIAYFRLMTNEQDEQALLRVINYPKRGIGDTTINKLREKASAHKTSLASILSNLNQYDLGLNKGTLTKLENFNQLLENMRKKCQEETDFYNLCQWLINTSGIPQDLMLDSTPEGKNRVNNLNELLVSLDEYAHQAKENKRVAKLEDYVNEVNLLSEQDKDLKESSNIVTLMTIHASKGLEFPHVFIVGLEEQLFPSAMSLDPHEIEEERRLLYVAITRAEKTCHIAYARERFRNGRTEISRPSRFLRELPNTLIKRTNLSIGNPTNGHQGVAQSWLGLPEKFSPVEITPMKSQRRVRTQSRVVSQGEDKAETKHEAIGSLRLGSKVRHARFGLGLILSLEGDADNAKAIVRFANGDEKKLLLRFANLEVIN